MTLETFLLAGMTTFFAFFLWDKRKRKKAIEDKIRATNTVLNADESSMYFRLKKALPEYEVLAKVAFGSLITSQNFNIAHGMNLYVADFVICTRNFDVVAIIALDKLDNLTRSFEETGKDEVLKMAGHKTFRYNRVPHPEQLRFDITGTRLPEN